MADTSSRVMMASGFQMAPTERPSIRAKSSKGLAVTGDQAKILNLAALGASRVGKELVIEGRWFSADHIRVKIISALVAPAKAAQLARKVLREEPMIAWLPVFHETEDDNEYLRDDKKSYTPWIVCPSGESRLDECDPYGVSVANTRPSSDAPPGKLSRTT